MTAVLSTAQDAFFDVLKTVPLLLLVYALLYYIENRLTDTPALLSRTAQFGPAVGALAGSIFQPLLCAVLGLVPSCAMSVLLSELYVSGTISFGALVAGLSTGAGFGYIVLLGEKQGRRRAAPVILATFVLAAVGGTVTQLLFG